MMRGEYLPKSVTASYLAPVALNPACPVPPVPIHRGCIGTGRHVCQEFGLERYSTNNFHYRRLQEDKICIAFSLRSAPVSP